MDTRHPPQLMAADSEGSVYSLEEGVTLIGRSKRNEICLRDASVSRFHCRLERSGDSVRVFDSMSRNPTLLGSEPADGKALRDGDVLCVGRCRLIYRGPTAAAAAAPESSVPAATQSPLTTPGSGGHRSREHRSLGHRPRRPRRRLPATAPAARPSILPLVLIGGGVMIILGWIVGRAVIEHRKPTVAEDGQHSTDVSNVRRTGSGVGISDELLRTSREIDSLRSERDALEARVKDLSSSRASDADLQDVLLQLQALQAKLQRSESEREALEDRLLERARSAKRDAERRSKDGARREIDRRTEVVKRPPVMESPTELAALVERLKRTLDEYADPATRPASLEPDLTRLTSAAGAAAAAGALDVLRHAASLSAHVELSVEGNRRTRRTLLREAEAMQDKLPKPRTSDYGSRYNKPGFGVELKQRELELRTTALRILERQAEDLKELVGALGKGMQRFRDVDATKHLASRFSGERSAIVRHGILRSLAAARARHAVPLLIRKLGAGDEELRAAVRRTLTTITGNDQGDKPSAWRQWWETHGDG